MAVANRNLFTNLLIAGCLLLFAFPVFSATIRVPADQPTIQAGIDASIDGDTVLVADGLYRGTGNIDIDITKSIKLLSENGPGETIIDGEEMGRGFQIRNDTGIVVDGFTIRNTIGIPIFDFFNGGGMFIKAASLDIRNCVFERCSANLGGGIYFEHISQDTLNYTVSISNCTFINDSAFQGGAIFNAEFNAQFTIDNCIFTANTSTYPTAPIYGALQRFTITCSDIYGNPTGDWVGLIADLADSNGNFSKDPLFCDPSQNEFRLQANSPCQPDSTSCGLVGAFKVGCNTKQIWPIVTNFEITPVYDTLVISAIPKISWRYYDLSDSDQVSYEIEIGTDSDWSIAEVWTSGAVMSQDSSIIYSGSPLQTFQTYYIRIRVSNTFGSGVWADTVFTVQLPRTRRVPSEHATIQDAIDNSIHFDTVLVADGLYSGSGNESLNFSGKNVYLKSENGAKNTIIKGNGISRAINVTQGEDTTATLDGFTITHSAGVAVINSSFRIKNCRIENNGSGSGTCYFSSTEPKRVIVESCIFLNNDASVGGAIRVGGSMMAKVTNSIFSENFATSGAAIYVGKSANTIVNGCTFYKNVSPGGALIHNWRGNVQISNSIIAYNDCSAVGCQGGVFTIECTDIFGNEEDWTDCIMNEDGQNGNISKDPVFCDTIFPDLNILENSPCHPDSSLCGLIGAGPVGCGAPIRTPPIAKSITVSPNSYGIVTSLSPTFSWVYLDTGTTSQTQFELELSENSPRDTPFWSSGVVNSPDTSIVYPGALLDDNEYFLRLRLHNGSEFGDWIYTSFETHITRVLRVPSEYSTIGSALAGALNLDTVLIANGTYTGSANKNLIVRGRVGLVIRSENGPEATIIDCEGSGRAFLFGSKIGANIFEVDSTVKLEGFTIKNGFADDNGGAILGKYGAPTIKNCLFLNNEATFTGGAMFFTGLVLDVYPRIFNCTFVGNSSIVGGAVYTVYNGASIEINNSLFTANYSAFGGSPVATDPANPASICVYCSNIYSNTGGDWGALIADLADTNGNMSLDPLFCDTAGGNYAIDSLSPCSPSHPLNECGELIGAIGAGCANCVDDDFDFICATSDNCDDVSNPDQADTDGDGIGDACCCTGNRGDFNGDGSDANIIDLTFLADFIFRGSGAPGGCPNEGDINGDGNTADILDLTYLVDVIFRGGTAPLACP